MNNDYIVKQVYRSFLIVMLLSAISSTLGSLVDNIIVGRFLGDDALAAMGIVAPIILLYFTLGALCAGGGSILASQAMGRGDTDGVQNIFSVSVWFGIISGLIICTLGLLFSDALATLLGANPSLHALSVSYLRGYMLGSIPIILLSALMSFVQIDGSPQLPIVATVAMTVSDVILDLLVAVVLHGGMFGMAMASTLSYFIAVGVLCLHFTKKNRTLRLTRPKAFGKNLQSMAVTSTPVVVTCIGELVRIAVLNNMLVVIAVSAVAALNIRSQANNIIGALAMGGAQALGPMAGMFYGEEDRATLGQSLKSALKQGLILNLVVALIFVFVPWVFPRLMGVTDAETAGMASTAILWLAVSLPIRFVNLLLTQYYQTTKHTALAVTLSVLEVLAYPLAAAALLIRPLGPEGVWISFPIAEALTFVTAMVFILLKTKSGSLLHRVLMLPEDFGGSEADKLSVSIGNSMDEVMEMSRSVYAFGEERGVSKETMNKVSLCIEEMAGNVVQHSFKPGEKRWFDLLVYIKPDTILLRMRDNGRPFDPLARLREQAEHDPEKNLGLKVINGITDSFEYRNGVGLNICVMNLLRR